MGRIVYKGANVTIKTISLESVLRVNPPSPRCSLITRTPRSSCVYLDARVLKKKKKRTKFSRDSPKFILANKRSSRKKSEREKEREFGSKGVREPIIYALY